MTSLERLKVYAATGCTVTLSPTDVRMLCDMFTAGERLHRDVREHLRQAARIRRQCLWLLAGAGLLSSVSLAVVFA